MNYIIYKSDNIYDVKLIVLFYILVANKTKPLIIINPNRYKANSLNLIGYVAPNQYELIGFR